MHLGVSSWVWNCIHRVGSSPVLGTDVWVVWLSVFHIDSMESVFLFLLLFSIAMEEVGGDDPYISLLTWQRQMNFYLQKKWNKFNGVGGMIQERAHHSLPMLSPMGWQ